MPKSDNSADNNLSIDNEEFKIMLHKIFPNTQNLDSKIKEMNEIDRKIDAEKEHHESASGTDSDSSESDFEYGRDNQQINIIVSMGNLDNLEEELDDCSDDDDDYITEEDSEYECDETELHDTSDIGMDDALVKDEHSDCKNKVKNSIISPIITRSKSKNKYSEENPKIVQEKKHSVVKPSSIEESKYSSKYNKLIETLMKNVEDTSEIEKKVSNGLKDFLESEKKYIDKKEAENLKKENKKLKIKNERKFKKLCSKRRNINSLEYFKKQEINVQKDALLKFEEIEENNKIVKPYSFIIVESKLPIAYKALALKKLKMFEHMDPGASDYYKNKLWVDTFMEIPFSKYANIPVTLESSSKKEIVDFMDMSMKTLDSVVYGLDDAKMQIMQIIGKWIANPDCLGNAFAINGPPGTGKTTLIKDGISKILNRPFAFIPLGGATDSSYLEGHSYTYEGSIWGKIVQILIDSKVMNPVIYFDELDKVSNSPRGEEIIGVLTHLTDTSQNSQFHDKYFSGIDFDLSKALFIFSYNDESKINPILKDRMYRINTKGYNNKDKQIISNKYILPNILRSINFKINDIVIDNDVLDYINQNLTENEKGVRNMKRCIETICSKLNLIRLSQNPNILGENIEINFTTPHKVKLEEVQKLIKIITTDFPVNMYC